MKALLAQGSSLHKPQENGLAAQADCAGGNRQKAGVEESSRGDLARLAPHKAALAGNLF